MSEAGTGFLSVSVGWTIYSIRHQPLDLGLVGLVQFIPSLLLVFIAGPAIDKFNRKNIMVAAAIASMLFAFTLGGLQFIHVKSVSLMLGVLFCQGIARAFGSPAERTILVNLVEPGAYMRVQAAYNSAREVISIAAPALAGFIVSFSESLSFTITGCLIFGAVIGFSLLHVRPTVRTGNVVSASSALGGVRFMRSRPIVLGAISLDLFAVLFGGATALLPVYAVQILNAGGLVFGLLRSSTAIGASMTAIYLTRHPPRRTVGRTMLLAVAGYGISMIAFAFSRNVFLSMAALAMSGGFDMISVVIRRGLVAFNTPDEMRGRVASIESVFILASSYLGSFESGVAAQIFGPVLGVALGGLATLGVVLTWALKFPSLRKSDRIDERAARASRS